MGSSYFWKTKEGTTVHITDMETSHIINAMNLIEKKGFAYDEHWSLEADFNVTTHNLRPIYENMRVELRLRKLEGAV